MTRRIGIDIMKIRKNSSKKIKALIEKATRITSCSQHRCMHSDCYVYGDDITITADRASEFYADQYSEINRVWLESDEQGEPVELVISTWKTTITLTFAPVEPEQIEIVEVAEVAKPRLTANQVAALRSKGFVSPLSHEAIEIKAPEDADKKIINIRVKMTESKVINRTLKRQDGAYGLNQDVALDEYNFLSARQAQEHKAGGYAGGYDKTFLEITTETGEVYEYRHDISPKAPNLQAAWGAYVDYCRAQHESKKAVKH